MTRVSLSTMQVTGPQELIEIGDAPVVDRSPAQVDEQPDAIPGFDRHLRDPIRREVGSRSRRVARSGVEEALFGGSLA